MANRFLVGERRRAAKGRRWTIAEDDAIRAAAAVTRTVGLHPDGGAEVLRAVCGEGQGGTGRADRLRVVADELGRTYASVRKRASRLGVHSIRRFGSYR